MQEEEEKKQPPLLSSSDRSDIKSNLGKDPIKIVVVGPQGTGKTSLIQNMYGKEFQHETKSTNCYEVNRKILSIDGRDVELRIWDCSTYHDQSYSIVKKSFYKNALCAIIVVDLNSYETIEHYVEVWNQECQDNEILNTVVIGNKLDLLLQDIDKPTEGFGQQIEIAQAKPQIDNNGQDVQSKISYCSEIICVKKQLEIKGMKVFFGSCKETYKDVKPYNELLINIIRDAQQPNQSRVGSHRPQLKNEEDKNNASIAEQVIDLPTQNKGCCLI